MTLLYTNQKEYFGEIRMFEDTNIFQTMCVTFRYLVPGGLQTFFKNLNKNCLVAYAQIRSCVILCFKTFNVSLIIPCIM